MRVIIQLTEENRIHFFNFDESEMPLKKICRTLVSEFGNCKPFIVYKNGLTTEDEQILNQFMDSLIRVYNDSKTQLSLF